MPLARFAIVRILSGMTDLAKEITRHAKKAGIDQRKDLAERIGISRPHMSDLMNGRKQWTVPLITATANALSVGPRVADRWKKLAAAARGWA
jgi:transcriptional regulator with XRE-family HTH domain